jgi:hypothetical protein
MKELSVLEIGSRHFVPGGHMPCLDQFGMLPRLLAVAIGSAPENAPRRLVLFGHACDEIFPEFNFDLSHRRGLALRALILQDSLAWKLAAFGASTDELSYTLAGIAGTMGWDCDTNKRGHLIENAPSDALRLFQTTCLHRYRSPQLENGLPSVVCWHGVYCVLTELVRNCLRQMYPTVGELGFDGWPIPKLGYENGLGVFPCGASFSTTEQTKTNFSRRVDLVFLPEDVQLQAGLDRKAVYSTQVVPIYDDRRFNRVPMQDPTLDQPMDTLWRTVRMKP